MKTYTEKEFHLKAEQGYARIETQMAKQIKAIKEAQSFDLSHHVWQAAAENAYLDNQEAFDNDALNDDILEVLLGGAESIIERFYLTGWY